MDCSVKISGAIKENTISQKEKNLHTAQILKSTKKKYSIIKLIKQTTFVESLAMDLLRVALGFHRGSPAMAERFKEEALSREKELNLANLKNGYLKRLLVEVKLILKKGSQKNAEDILMYSVLFQNFARKYYS